MSTPIRSSTVAPAREISLPRRISGAIYGMVPLSILIVLDRHADFVCMTLDLATFSKVGELADQWLMASTRRQFCRYLFPHGNGDC